MENQEKKPHPRQKYEESVVSAVRTARFEEERSLTWIAKKFDIPIDTIRDWIYRGRRA